MNKHSTLLGCITGEKSSLPSDAIAIISMAGRFPGVKTTDELWKMICDGKSVFERFPVESAKDVVSQADRQSPDYVPVRPALEDIENFDAGFFGMYPAETASTDPQQRVFLEICWEALESAGYDPFDYAGLIGVFAGATLPTYMMHNVLGSRDKIEEFTTGYPVSCYNERVGSLNEALAMRVSYKLNLRGPAFSIQSACSTSLLSVTQACMNLQTYTCDMALAGGVSITVPQKRGYIAQEGGIVSQSGTCRPFDEKADGTVFGSAAGVVLLKRLDDSIADKDNIVAVIRGFGVNNDGADKIGFTAPSVSGQTDVIATALANADVDPASIGFIECHGTATPLGDPIEFSCIRSAYGAEGDRCALGSLKGNIGHSDAAAGICGLIKAALAVKNATIPKMANYTSPNPKLALGNDRFWVPLNTEVWDAGSSPRRAGVSSLGFGGTNVHLVLEEAPQVEAESSADKGKFILPLSARDDYALSEMRENLAQHLRETPDISLRSVAHTLQHHRHVFEQRSVAVASTIEEAAEKLVGARLPSSNASKVSPPVIFMFPGQGAQYIGMGAALHQSEPEFARWIDLGAEQLKPLLKFDIRDFICHADQATPEQTEQQRETHIAQPCLYLVEYALARLWMSRGVQPHAMIGHSVGEFVAAALSNVISFNDGVRLVEARGALMRDQQQGAMVSVRSNAEAIMPTLPKNVEIAARNAPELCVISGPFDAVDRACENFARAGIAFSRLHTSHAFHSAMMEDAVKELRRETAKVTYGKVTIPFISCVTGTWQNDEQSSSPDYWARHCREAVEFAKGLKTLCEGQEPMLLEVGPGRALSTFATQSISRKTLAGVLQSLPEYENKADADEIIAQTHGRIWIAGCSINWPQYEGDETRKIELPTYPFQRQRHWIDEPEHQNKAQAQTNEAALPSLAQVAKEPVTMNVSTRVIPQNRIPALTTSLLALLSEMSGENYETDDSTATYLELGFDSLFIGQFAQKVEKQFKVKLSFRELLSNIPSVADLAAYLDAQMPAETVEVAVQEAAPSALEVSKPAPNVVQPVSAPAPVLNSASGIESIIQQQLQLAQNLFSQQLQTLQGAGHGVLPQTFAPPLPPLAADNPSRSLAVANVQAKTLEDVNEYGTDRFKIYKPKSRSEEAQMAPEKARLIDDLVKAYVAKNPKSKSYVASHREHLADPRTASGFRDEWKEMVFPIVADRSKGSRIWDIDGNEYIDLVSGYGQTAFGHSQDFVIDAINAQMQLGFAIGPQSTLAGEVADKLAEMTGQERVTFCNTGSEAVMAAMRVARSVTGNDRVVVFANDYHGQFDEVLVKGSKRAGTPVALPIATGIPATSLTNMTVLKYGAQESLDWIRDNADEIAAVVVEPIQSRHPENQPMAFVRTIREIATEKKFALVFDEVVTGFRVHRGGMQAIWDIKADMATYGKVLGGGMPIGILAGNTRFMGALDGGVWNYGDDSVPMVAPTFFAGTFVRHPLILAAIKATLNYIDSEAGAELYSRVAKRTVALVEEIKEDLAARGLHDCIEGYSSWFSTNFSAADQLGSLMYPQLRLRGVHVIEGYACFLTTAHSEDDFKAVAAAFRDSVDALQSVGILLPEGKTVQASIALENSQIQPDEMPRSAPLTEAQKEIWLAAQAGDEASCAFNESFTINFRGNLDESALLSAINTVIARHDALHTRFTRDGSFSQFATDFEISITRIDLQESDDAKAAFANILEAEANNAFHMVEGPLVRVSFVRINEDITKLVFTAHHIVCDGWSCNIITQEIGEAYRAALANAAADFEQAESFGRYAAARSSRGHVEIKAEKYWCGQFSTLPNVIDMPLDRPHPEYKTYNGGTRTGYIDRETYLAIKKAGGKAGATLFSTLLGTLQVMIAHMSGSNDIVVAIPSAGQSLLEKQTLVGHCVNLLPIRSNVTPDQSFEAHLKQVQRTVLDAFDHQDYTYGTLLRKLGVARDPRRLPLTEIQFNLERIGENVDFGALDVSIQPNAKAFANFDMFLNMIESADGIRIDVDYNSDVLDAATVDRWIGHFTCLAKAIAQDTTIPIGQLPLLTVSERKWLAETLNDTECAFDQDMFVHKLFAQNAAETPQAVAVVHKGRSLTYAQLDIASNRLAHHLQNSLPKAGQRIAILLERSLDMVVALLAVMKAGHTYVPMDTAHPEGRLLQTLQTAEIAGVLCDTDEMALLAPKDAVTIHLETDKEFIKAQKETAPNACNPADAAPAYIIFTSGSTGTPKGVEVGHKALANFMMSMAAEPGCKATDSLLAVTTISFDIAALEIYLPLITGAKSIIADRAQVQDGFELLDLIKKNEVTILQATPTLWRMLVEAGLEKNASLKMLSGGEPLPVDLAEKLAGLGGQLWNMYGPTETSIWSSLHRIEDITQPITIGHPIANTQLHIVNRQNQIAPIGVIGELLIAGDGLANGYFGRADLTQKAFVDLDLGKGELERLYRTGDVGRRLADGSIQLLGRQDNQVKLRGYRIELDDIESVVMAAPGVRRCAAVVSTNSGGDKHLVAYVLAQNSNTVPQLDELAAFAKRELPSHMVPAAWVVLDAFPQTGNGKLDRKALQEMGVPKKSVKKDKTLPSTEIEKALHMIWLDVLAQNEIDVNDDIYALGADSLSIFRIASRMLDSGLGLEAKHLLRYPSITQLAKFAGEQKAKKVGYAPKTAPSLRDFRNGAGRVSRDGVPL